MVTKPVSFSDLSGKMAEGSDGLVPLVVTSYPDSEPGQQRHIEVTPDERERIGQMAISAVVFETEPTNEEERRTQLVIPIGDLATLSTVDPIEEVLANAEQITTSRPQGNGQGQRRSHNKTRDGGPLVNYSDPENSGLPHNGRIGEKEGEFVRGNLELVNARRAAAGHPPINPEDPVDAERYGFSAPGETTAQERSQTSEADTQSDDDQASEHEESPETGLTPEQPSVPEEEQTSDSEPDSGQEATPEEPQGRQGRRRRG